MSIIEETTEIVAHGRLRNHRDDVIANDVLNAVLNTLVAYAPDHTLQWMEQMRKGFMDLAQKEMGK